VLVRSRMLFVLAFALCAIAVAAYVRTASGGSLDPAEPPASTMRSLDDVLPSWSATYLTAGADPCDTQRFRCVLGGQGVLDRETGLVWQKTPLTTAAANSEEANVGCATTKIGGRYGWRPPRFSELTTLFDDTQVAPAPSLPLNHPFVITTQTGYFWTLTEYPSDFFAVVRFVGSAPGSPGEFSVLASSTSGGYSWCVRGPAPDD
jgi:hypothetical protein